MGFPKLFVVLICFQTLSSHPHFGVSEENEDINDGILVIGGSPASQSIEFWSAADPEEGSCVLKDYPRELGSGPNVNLVSGQLVACYFDGCDTFEDGEWNHLVDTGYSRIYASSAVNDHRILLIGGLQADPDADTTEWIPVDGSPAQPGPFNAGNLGPSHCTIQTAPDRVVVTGGRRGNSLDDYTYDYVAEYQLTGDFTETPLTPMPHGRIGHGCGVYKGVGGQQVLLVTGGYSHVYGDLSSTEVAVYSSGSQLEWREVEGGQLPSVLFGLQVTLVDQTLYVNGGYIVIRNDQTRPDYDYQTSILSWDPVTESWQQAGDMVVARGLHAAVAVPRSTIAMYCKQKK